MTKTTAKTLGKHMYSQRGFAPIKPLLAIAGIGMTLVLLFVFVGSSSSPKINKGATTNNTAPAADTANTAPKSQPNVIRIPDSYNVYTNKDYKLSFAYPAQWADSIRVKGPNESIAAPTSSKLSYFTDYPIGSSVLNGQLIVLVDQQDAFKIQLYTGGATVAPVKLGDGYGWKVVQAGSADSTLKIGDSYNAKSATYQSGVTVYNFAMSFNNIVQSRWVFQSGDNFVTIALPRISRADGSAPSAADIASYNVVANNIAKTARPTN